MTKHFFAATLIVFLSVLGAAWYASALCSMAILDPEYGIWSTKIDMIKRCDVGSFVILGDSRPSAGLIPAEIGSGVVNLAFGGTDAIEAYFIAQRILACPHPPKAAVLAMSMSLNIWPYYYWDRSARFGLLDYTDLKDVRKNARHLKEEFLYGKKTPGDIEARLKMLLYAIKFPPFYFGSMINSWISPRAENNAKLSRETSNERGHHYYGESDMSDDLDPDTVIDRFEPNSVDDFYFNKTLHLFQEHNIPLYWVYMPQNPASSKMTKAAVKAQYADYIKKHMVEYPGFHVLGDVLPTSPKEYFGDFAHLNSRGATIWSYKLVQLLAEAGAPGGPFKVK